MSHLVHTPLADYCKQLSHIFGQALHQPDPAKFLCRHKARTPLFMAESLARVLHEVMQDEKTGKAYMRFKKPEDLLGAIEDYELFIKKFEVIPAIKKDELGYFVKKREKTLKKLNAKLLKKEFYLPVFIRVAQQLDTDLNKKAMVAKLQKHIRKELEDCFDFYSRYRDGFTGMEEQVHEIRRKLRWVTIYSQSFRGLIALEKDNRKYEWEKRFIPGSSAASAYNKVTINKQFTAYINYNRKAFFALNFVIEELGKIKDKGLKIEALAKSVKKNSEVGQEAATALALEKLNVNYTENDLLKEAHSLLSEFFDTYGIHKLLV